MDTAKLAENSTYKIIGYKPIKSSYGTTHILLDEELNTYWANNKVNLFINSAKLPAKISGDYYSMGKVMFTIKTGNESQKTVTERSSVNEGVTSNEVKEIKFLPVTIVRNV